MPPTIYNKRGTQQALASVNPVLGSGELCLETDTNRIKFGDGVTAWNSLNYAIISNSGTIINYPSISGATIVNSSGNFNNLSVNSVQVSVSGHTHTSSDITNFNSSVSGLLPVTNIVSGSGINVSASGSQFTISMIDDPRWAFFLPQAPADVTGLAANASVVLGWAPAVSPIPVTDYIIQYSSDSGSTWNTFVDGTSSSTTTTITGLTNGTSYIFRVKAVNAIGQGTFSNPSSSVTPAAGIPLASALLLHFDGSNGSTTFTDSSGNSYSLGVLSGSPQIITANSKFGGACLDSGGGAIGFLGGTFPDLSAGDFTLECWVWMPTGTSNTTLFGLGGPSCGLHLWLSSGTVQVDDFCAGQYSGGTITPDQWVHLAVVQASGDYHVYIDGTEVGSVTASPGIGPYVDLYVGGWNGFISNTLIDDLRLVIGTAVYTSNFSPPIGPLEQYVYIQPSLLMHFDGSNGSTAFTDSSPNGLTVTSQGTPTISTTQSKFGGSSLYLDGTDSLTISDSSFINFGTGDFTIDLWFYYDKTQSNNQYIYDMGSNDGQLQIFDNVYGFDGAAAFYFPSSNGVISQNAPLTSNTWYHIALTRNSGTLRLFVNGMIVASASDTSNYNGSTLTIGNYGGGGGYGLYGYIDELRIVKGAAVWTSNFTPPISPY